MHYIFLSPHCDDAVLSSGGLIFDLVSSGHSVEIITIMCGEPTNEELSSYAKKIHSKWGTKSAKETVNIRSQEDFNACGILGAKATHLDFPDCIYRKGNNGEFLYSHPISPIHPFDEKLVLEISQKLSDHIPGHSQVICQLAIGSHVDHVLVRKAMEQLKHPVKFMEDFPYILNNKNDVKSKTIGLSPFIHTISHQGLDVWKEAIAAYDSQLPMLFESPQSMQNTLTAYWSIKRGIYLWV